MTPTALTPAARRAAAQRAPTRPAANKGRTASGPSRAPRPSDGSHPRRLRRSSSPAAPRRVSGPLGRTATPRVAPRPSRPTAPVAQPIGARAGEFIRSLPDRSLIDRLVRGRAWIPVLGVMLAGIVAMQVEVLKLHAGTGRALQQTTQLTTTNEQLRINVATLADDQRIESAAARMGMVMPAPTAVGFLTPSGAALQQALTNLRAPNPTEFLNATSSNGTVAVSPSAPAATSTGGQ